MQRQTRCSPRLFTLVLAGMLGAVSVAEAAIRRVDTRSACSSGCNGSSWATAYVKLRDAIAASSSGDELWVARGKYYPDECGSPTCTDNSRTETFNISSPAVTLYGGFAGNESTRDQRDWTIYETILSGDIDKDNIRDAENSYHVVTYSTANATALLDGFTITMGYADGTNPNNQGGAVQIRNGTVKCVAGGPTIRNCTIKNNSASDHAAVNDHGLATVIENCHFQENDATTNGRGGAILIQSGPTIVRDCTFNDNFAAAKGGSIWIERDADATCSGGNLNYPTIERCTFTNHSGNTVGHCVYLSEAGVSQSQPVSVIDCTFTGNIGYSSADGVGLYALGSFVKVQRCLFAYNESSAGYGTATFKDSNAEVLDSIFINNGGYQATAYKNAQGGALWFQADTRNSTALVDGCTIANNRSLSGGGIYAENAGFTQTVTVKNSIIWGNSTSQIANVGGATTNITYSDIQGGYSGTGNINVDPQFQAGPCHAYQINSASPCVNAGDPASTLTTADACGRRKDAARTDYVDMGAFEIECPTQSCATCTPTCDVNVCVP